MSKTIKLKLSPGLCGELDNSLNGMASSPPSDPARGKGEAALAAIKTSGKRGHGMLVTDDPAVARTVLGELAWIGWQCDGYDPSARAMIGAARRAHAKLEALLKEL